MSRFRSLLRLGEPASSRDRQLVFLHIQKAGGNTVLNFIGQHFLESHNLQVYSPAEFDAYHPAEVPHFDLVCGHITARNLAAVRRDALLCTFLREPIDRVLSCYWYFRGYSDQKRASIRYAVESAKSNSLLGFLRDPTPEVQMHIFNHQARALAGDWQVFDDRPAADLLADALSMLEQFHCVGVTEQIDRGVEHLCRLTGWKSPPPLDRQHATPYRQRIEELTAAELEALRELTALDVEVYRAAWERSEDKLANVNVPITEQRTGHDLSTAIKITAFIVP